MGLYNSGSGGRGKPFGPGAPDEQCEDEERKAPVTEGSGPTAVSGDAATAPPGGETDDRAMGGSSPPIGG